MPVRRIPVSLHSFLAGSVFAVALAACGPAAAEIYGWVDTDGSYTYSNLPPPKGARVTDVIPEIQSGSRIPSSELSRQAQLAALNDRIRLLELERDRAQRQVVEVPAAPQYMPPPPAYGVGYGCDGYDYDCGGYAVPLYTVGVAPAYYYYGGRYGAQRGVGHAGAYPGYGGRFGHGGSRPAHAALATPGHGGGRR